MTDKNIAEIKPDPFVEMVERLSAMPDLNPDTVQKFLDMQVQIMDRKAKDEFYAAMSRVQAAIPSVMPDSRNPQTHSDYASLQAISRAIKPIYTTEGFSASFWEGKDAPEDAIRIEGTLRHRDGHSEPYGVNLALDDVGIKGNVNKTKVHATGSTFTYGRRYLTCMMFDVAVGFDLDGNQPDAGHPIRDHFQIIAQIKQHIADDEPKKAVKEWRSLGPDVMDELWVAPTKGGVFTVVECTALREASKANPDQKSGKAWQDKLDADDERLRKELDAQAKAEE